MSEPRRPTRIRRRVATTLVSIGVTLAGMSGAEAQETEEILAYDVRIEVQEDARLVVTEEITVRGLGVEIRRGIYRDFPTGFPRASGLGRIEAPFAVLDVRRDGQVEPYTLSSIGGPRGRGGMRVRIGDANVFLEPGIYRYTIQYETERWVAFGDRQDVLYWNVTGNGWGFPIRAASARVHVENLSSEPTLEGWTGPEGSTTSNVQGSWDSVAAEAIFATTTTLAPNEGLTIRLSFPTGVLVRPSEEKLGEWFRLDWGGYIDSGYVILLVVAMYLLMWRRVGVDPVAAPTVLRRDPPPGLSPAALGYLTERGYDTSQFAAALVSMAMKGAIRIERTGSAWSVSRVDPEAELSPEERKLFDAILADRASLELKQSRHATLRKGIGALKKSLSRRFEREYFVNNRQWFAAGLILSVAGFAVLAWRWRFAIEPEAWFLGLWLTGWTAGVATLVVRIWQTFKHARSGGGAIAWAGSGGLLLFSIPFVGAEILVIGLLSRMVPGHLILAAACIGVTNVLFYHLLERPTLRGRGILDHLDGFRAFLAGKTDEARRPVRQTQPSVELFERFLPHAIALRVENRWAEGFGEALAPGGAPGRTYATPWYSHDHHHLDASSFASSLGASLSSTLSASSSPPSSSGGGGGGSSGGGGGGGGGGGW